MLFKYLSMHLRSKMQYKISFIFIVLAQLILISTSFIAMYSLFDRFGGIKGFTLYEVLISFSVVHLGYSIAQIFGRGFDHFKKLIRAGTFDLLLIKPRNIYLQIIGSNIAYEKIGRALGSLLILIYALNKIEILDINRIWLVLPMIISSVVIFISIFIIGAAITFYTIEGLELVNIISDGSKEVGQYPVGIFNKNLLIFFTFVIPISSVNYYPVLYMLGRSNNILYAISPLLGTMILIPAILIFNSSLKKYQGTGS
jgi:ABC-2 type transport system permease protein